MTSAAVDGAGAPPVPLPAPVSARCRRPARPTSRPARCSTGSARSTRSRSGRPGTRSAARWCTRCSTGSSTCPPAEPVATTAAAELVEPEWQRLVEAEPEVAELFADGEGRRAGRAGWSRPAGWSPATSRWRTRAGWSRPPGSSWWRPCSSSATAAWSCAATSTGWTWRRPARSGWSTTRPAASPREAYEAKALFQLKFYALVLWRTRGTVPHQLKLMYLADRDTLTYRPDAASWSGSSGRWSRCGGRSSGRCSAGDFRRQPEPAVRLVRPPGAVPGLRRHPAAVAGARPSPAADAAAHAGRRRDSRSSRASSDRLSPGLPRQRDVTVPGRP